MKECEDCGSKVKKGKGHYCSAQGRRVEYDEGNFLLSAAIGAVTGSALLGGLLGGDLLGGIVGDALDGDLFD